MIFPDAMTTPGIFKPIARNYDVVVPIPVQIADAFGSRAAVVLADAADDRLFHTSGGIVPRDGFSIVGQNIDVPVAIDVAGEDIVTFAEIAKDFPGRIGIISEVAGILEPYPRVHGVHEAVQVAINFRRSELLVQRVMGSYRMANPRRVINSLKPVGRLRLASREAEIQIAIPIEVCQRRPPRPPRRTRQPLRNRKVRPARRFDCPARWNSDTIHKTHNRYERNDPRLAIHFLMTKTIQHHSTFSSRSMHLHSPSLHPVRDESHIKISFYTLQQPSSQSLLTKS